MYPGAQTHLTLQLGVGMHIVAAATFPKWPQHCLPYLCSSHSGTLDTSRHRKYGSVSPHVLDMDRLLQKWYSAFRGDNIKSDTSPSSFSWDLFLESCHCTMRKSSRSSAYSLNQLTSHVGASSGTWPLRPPVEMPQLVSMGCTSGECCAQSRDMSKGPGYCFELQFWGCFAMHTSGFTG